MAEAIPNLYRRAPVQINDPNALYNYGQHPGFSFFDRIPLGPDDAVFYDDFSSGYDGIGSLPDYDAQSVEQPSLADAAVPGAGAYLGGKIGTKVGEGLSFGDAVAGTFDDIGTSVTGAFDSVGNMFTPGVAETVSSSVGSIPSGAIVNEGLATGLAESAVTPVASSAGEAAGTLASGAGESAASGWGSSLFQGGSALGSAGVGLGSAIGGLIMGQKPGKAILGGVDSAVGYYVGGPVGGFVGNIVGSVLPGRVVCTELLRQGLIEKDLLRAELAHTKQHIPRVTMEGYWLWGVPLVRLMKKSPLATRLIRPIAVWRAEEVAYQMGMRDKPNHLGKLVRLVGESLCWALGHGLRAARFLKSKFQPTETCHEY